MSDSQEQKSEGDAEPKPESRLARHRRIAGEIYAEPRTAGEHLRRALITVWVSHGAGFYGLGWICAFLALEFNMITGELAESEGVGDFLGSQILEYLLRFGLMSFINGLLASIWPVYVFEWIGMWAIALLLGGYFAFEKLLRPAVESWAPELRDARLAAEEKAAEKSQKKADKKAARDAKKKEAD